MREQRRTRRRLAATILVVVAIVAAFGVRLVDIQVVRAEQLAQESEARRSIPVALHGVRGDIVDRRGTVLADSVFRYDITVSPRFVKDYDTLDEETGELTTRTVWEALTGIAAITGEDPAAMLALIEGELAEDPDDDHAYLVRGVETDVFQAARSRRALGLLRTGSEPHLPERPGRGQSGRLHGHGWPARRLGARPR